MKELRKVLEDICVKVVLISVCELTFTQKQDMMAMLVADEVGFEVVSRKSEGHTVSNGKFPLPVHRGARLRGATSLSGAFEAGICLLV